MDRIKLQNIINELREEVQTINAKIDALEAELHCSEPDEADVPRIEDEELTPEEEAAVEALIEEYAEIFETKPTNQAVAIASPITINIGNLSMGNLPIDYAAPLARTRQIKPLEGAEKLGEKSRI